MSHNYGNNLHIKKQKQPTPHHVVFVQQTPFGNIVQQTPFSQPQFVPQFSQPQYVQTNSNSNKYCAKCQTYTPQQLGSVVGPYEQNLPCMCCKFCGKMF